MPVWSKGEAFAVDASVMEADASRYHGKAPDEIDWSAPERQTRAIGRSYNVSHSTISRLGVASGW